MSDLTEEEAFWELSESVEEDTAGESPPPPPLERSCSGERSWLNLESEMSENPLVPCN